MGAALSDLTFLCPPVYAGHIPHPKPAAEQVPQWYRDLPIDLGTPDAQGNPGRTARACLPMADAFALGWMLPLPFDIAMSRDPQGQLMFHWADGVPEPPITLLHPRQLGGEAPPFDGALPLAFLNPWRIVLPSGYSAAVLHPINHADLPFRTFGAVVDCDSLQTSFKIPFLWTTQAESWLLPAGTPIAQVIPMKRADAPPEAEIRAETPHETAARQAAQGKSAAAYAKAWHRKHAKEGT